MPDLQVTLASRDSLLALAQTVEAAMRLERAGFRPRIATMKTAGDLKLNAPLYEIAQASANKEGRAFFTRELDDALLSGRAQVAVHSFKDLPAEPVAGISEPVYFSEQAGSDILLLKANAKAGPDGADLVIGTSSLRRIHQLRLVLPGARALSLRGNIITRMQKLAAPDSPMNSILLASAGLRRLEIFARVPKADYAHLMEGTTLDHITHELTRFAEQAKTLTRRHKFPEEFFPTAPGQGVLALQMTEAFEKRFGARIREAFSEHGTIAARVQHERAIMTGLNTGCHAPLGVSVLRDEAGKPARLVACFSRKSTTEPLEFYQSVYLDRKSGDATPQVISELLSAPENVYWWGKPPYPNYQGLAITGIEAIVQERPESIALPEETIDAVFVASAEAARYLASETKLAMKPVYTAGEQTAAVVRELIPTADIRVPAAKGFSAALDMLQNRATALLWIGSKNGVAAARVTAADFPHAQFLPVYENIPQRSGHLASPAGGVHALSSAAAAQAFLTWAKDQPASANWQLCCFGPSAAAVLTGAGFKVSFVSEAADFGEFLAEIAGDTELMRRRWKPEEEIDGKNQIR